MAKGWLCLFIAGATIAAALALPDGAGHGSHSIGHDLHEGGHNGLLAPHDAVGFSDGVLHIDHSHSTGGFSNTGDHHIATVQTGATDDTYSSPLFDEGILLSEAYSTQQVPYGAKVPVNNYLPDDIYTDPVAPVDDYKAPAKINKVPAKANNALALAASPKCPPKTVDLTVYQYKLVKVPILNTVYSDSYVPSTVYEPVYKTVNYTSSKTEYVPKYATTTEQKHEVKYVPEYKTKYQTVYKTQYLTKTEYIEDYVTEIAYTTFHRTKVEYKTAYKTQILPTYITTTQSVYETQYVTRPIHKYKTVVETSIMYKTVCPNGPAWYV